MRAYAVLFLVACGAPHQAAIDGGDQPMVDASHGHDGANPPHGDAAPVADAVLGPDAYVAACDTVTSDRVVHAGDSVTTCLSSDQDVDTYRFTAPNDAAGGILRMKLDFTECQLSFALWLDNDNSYPNIQTDDSFDTMYVGQLDHNLVQVTYPGLGYHLVVKKRRPFTGTCSYTLSTTYAAINDQRSVRAEPGRGAREAVDDRHACDRVLRLRRAGSRSEHLRRLRRSLLSRSAGGAVPDELLATVGVLRDQPGPLDRLLRRERRPDLQLLRLPSRGWRVA